MVFTYGVLPIGDVHVCITDKQNFFEQSLQAELDKRPHLADLNPKKLAVKDEPGILFRGRLQGYFAARKLCRLWVLDVFDSAIIRGEPFVKWVDPLDPKNRHDGTHVFAHFMTIKYISIHKPEMSIRFDTKGALKSSSDCVRKLQDYIWAHRRTLARRCHDMLKQKYSTKTHSLKAWEALNRWMFHNPICTQARVDRLVSFNKTDDDLHSVVGKCLWALANGDNRPWGVAALHPRGYAAVPTKDKVFFLFTFTSVTHM